MQQTGPSRPSQKETFQQPSYFVPWTRTSLFGQQCKYESDELAEDSEEEKKLWSAERRALAKIREKKRKNASSWPTPARYPLYIQWSSIYSWSIHWQLFFFWSAFLFFRMQSFRGRQPQLADKCFSCGQISLWANPSSCPSRFRGAAAPPSKQ